jgi:hypothetical protein
MRKSFKVLTVMFAALALAAVSIEIALSTGRKSVGFIIAAVGFGTFFLVTAFRKKTHSTLRAINAEGNGAGGNGGNRMGNGVSP